jgi:HEXXH motif-containing protein
MADNRAARGRALRERLRALAPLAGDDVPLPAPPEGGESALRSALLHHALYEVERACEIRDSARLREGFALAALDPVGNEPLVVDATSCHRTEDRDFASTIYTVRPGAPASAHRELVRAATARVAAAGQSEWLEQGLGVLVLCDRAHAGRPAFSYSVGALPHTVFTDWADDPLVVGEALVHESGHCWLNAALLADGERLPSAPLLPSPWKGVPRPPFALLHAALAFSLVAAYFQAQLEDGALGDVAREYCNMRANIEEHRVRAAHDDVGRVLELVGSESIRQAVENQMSIVVGQPGPGGG